MNLRLLRRSETEKALLFKRLVVIIFEMWVSNHDLNAWIFDRQCLSDKDSEGFKHQLSK